MKKLTEVESGFIKIKPNNTDSKEPSYLEFEIKEIKEGCTEKDVVEDALMLYMKTYFPDTKFKKITGIEEQRALSILKEQEKNEKGPKNSD